MICWKFTTILLSPSRGRLRSIWALINREMINTVSSKIHSLSLVRLKKKEIKKKLQYKIFWMFLVLNTCSKCQPTSLPVAGARGAPLPPYCWKIIRPGRPNIPPPSQRIRAREGPLNPFIPINLPNKFKRRPFQVVTSSYKFDPYYPIESLHEHTYR